MAPRSGLGNYGSEGHQPPHTTMPSDQRRSTTTSGHHRSYLEKPELFQRAHSTEKAMSRTSLNVPNGKGHSRAISISSVFSSPKKKEIGTIRGSIERPKVIVPYAVEKRFGSAIGTRTATLPQFKELGPPDLVHLSKYNSQTKKEEGEYHFITGIDVSSAVAPMAYLTMLNLNQTTASLKHPTMFTYCAFNAFSRADVRIRTEFPTETPGNYKLQQLPADRRNKIVSEVSAEEWEETYVSGMVRSIITGVDIERKMPALIEKTLLQNTQHAKYAISIFVKFLDRGVQLGASDIVNKPSIYENHLVDALFLVAEITSLHDFAIEELQKCGRHDTDLFVTKLLFASDREVGAVRYLHTALKANSRNVLLLNEQVRFLISKGERKLALHTALSAVKANPLNSESWYNLTKCHIMNDDLNGALIALNSMPMYGSRPKDTCIPDQKDTIYLPEPSDGKVKSVWESCIQVWGRQADNLIAFIPHYEIQAVDPALLRINRQQLRGTHANAYDLLMSMTNKVGWDGLLKARTEVFLMDEEFRSMSTLSLQSDVRIRDIRDKRQCERWLDDLFLMLYEDLRVVLIVENELQNEKQLKHSALEWELIGLTGFRTHHYQNCVAALRTAVTARFDIVAAKRLLTLWQTRYMSKESEIWRRVNRIGDIDMSLDVVLTLILSVLSYNIRFYNEANLDMCLFLKQFLLKYDSEFIKNKIQVLFENDNNDLHNSGIIPPFNKLVDTIRVFSPEL